MVNLLPTQLHCLYLVAFFFAISNYPVSADTRIAVFEFALKDMTLISRTAQELERTASIKPLLQSALEEGGHYQMVQVDMDAQMKADSGVGYLFNHHDVAADLGEKFGAQYVVVGQIHKPSFLFVYLMAHLVEVKSKRLIGDYIVEIKGPQRKITAKGVETLANKIKATINP